MEPKTESWFAEEGEMTVTTYPRDGESEAQFEARHQAAVAALKAECPEVTDPEEE